ncbi:MAG: GNAT family N-acetyltransferase [Candidatus Thorarchaeota archaeon]|nr:GNAT family N-acetyltransferase [Candidatus Thorarchaeota archaeon]
MGSKYNLRSMTNNDWDILHEMEQEIFEEDQLRKDHFINTVKKGNYFAMEIDGQIFGELNVARFGSDEAHLRRIGVAKSHQRKGYGTILMKHAIDWFKKEDGISTVHLYTQDHNIPAQSLYRKFGFKVTGITWHYFVPFASLKPERKYTCQEILDDEIDFVGDTFPTLPAAQIRRFLEDTETKNYVLTLKDKKGNIMGVSRFTPSFPGSFPFEITRIDCFDDFIKGMEKLSISEFDYVRTTFTDNKELAKVCEEREYHLHHKLHKMSLNL